MQLPEISLRFINALNLSQNERAVFDALISFSVPQKVVTLARKADIPRTTTLYILKKFEKRKIAIQFKSNPRRQRCWMPHRGLSHIHARAPQIEFYIEDDD